MEQVKPITEQRILTIIRIIHLSPIYNTIVEVVKEALAYGSEMQIFRIHAAITIRLYGFEVINELGDLSKSDLEKKIKEKLLRLKTLKGMQVETES